MAVNCSVSPLATDGFTGATAIDVSAAARHGQRVARAGDPAERGGDRGGARGQGGGQSLAAGGVGDRRNRGRPRRPGHLVGEVGGRAVGVGPRGRELLGEPLGHRRIHRRHRDRRQRGRGHRQGVARAGDPAENGGDRGRARGQSRGQPWLPAVLEMVATEAVADAQVTWLVRLAVVPSV